ncbi:Ig-like domain-containing protein [Seohaeicola saemankumensis]
MDFVVRPAMGATRRGRLDADSTTSVIDVSAGAEVSFNIRQFELKAYDKVGSDLHVSLADGRVIVLKGYFGEDESAVARLFISADGYLSEVILREGADGVLYAQYGPTEAWGKWSPHEDLVFLNDDEILAPLGVDDEGGDNEVSMLGAGLLLGGGGLGAAGGVAALAAGSVAAGALLGNGDAPQPGPRPVPAQPDVPVEQIPSGPRLPTVNERDPIVRGGADTPSIGISGTADPAAQVEVTIGDKVVVTRPDQNGNWQVVFEGDNFPRDGTYPVDVEVTQPGGGKIDLTGPSVVIDTTPPELRFTEGTVSAGHVVNADNHRDGVEISGTSEADARIAVTIGNVTHEETANGQGQWSVRFTPAELPEGDYTRDVTVTATDGYGNSASFRDTVRVDTIPDPIVIQSWLVAGDGVVNRAEAAGDLIVTGTSTPGNTLTLALFNGTSTITRSVPVQGDGTWRVTYPAGSGEHEATLTATTSDHAGNIGRATAAIRVDTLHHLTIDAAPLGTNNVINADAADAGVMLRGTTQPGSRVEVRFGSITRQAVVADDGTWSARFAGSDFARDEYDATFNVTARDAAGNVDMASRTVRVDTVVDVTIDDGIGRDGLINDAVRQAGVRITGTTDPGAEVWVKVGDVTKQAEVDGAGLWRVRFETADLPEGQGSLAVSATATDAARNSNSANRTVTLDTEVRDFNWTSTGVAADGVINGDDAGDGLFVTGQVEPGSRVMVTLDGVEHEARVLGDGRWSVRFSPSEIRSGEYVTELRAVATDRAQNVDEIRQSVRVDTRLNLLELAGPVTGDNTINFDEARDGFAVTGRVEALPGVTQRSTVQVEFQGQFYQASVDAAGNWRAFIPGADVPQGNHVLDMVVHARDAAGNEGRLTQVLTIDTDMPTNPIVASYTRDAAGIRSVSIELTGDQITLTEIEADGDMTPVENVAMAIAPLGETLHSFGHVAPGGGFVGDHLPDGSNLLITATDTAGNASGTFLAFDALSTSVIDLSGPIAAGSRIDAIDLTFAEDSTLTLTEAQILALSPDQRSLTIHGGSDDSVTLTGALRDGTEVVEGRNYAVYSMGEARVIVDEDVRIF